MTISNMVVFCGSKEGSNPIYLQHAKALGALLTDKGIGLIYGGGGKGIMGAVATGVLANNGKVTGIIPEHLLKWEAEHKEVEDMIVTEDMHSRKKLLYSKADAAIILAGGFGTLDEMFEILTWNQLSLHQKKIFLINSNGFYSHLIAHMNKMFEEGFLYHDLSESIIVLNDIKELEAHLN